VTRTHPSEPPVGKRQMTVGVQTGRDSKGVGRQVTLEHVVAADVVDTVLGGRHVEAAVAERVEVPVPTIVRIGHPFSDAVDRGLDL